MGFQSKCFFCSSQTKKESTCLHEADHEASVSSHLKVLLKDKHQSLCWAVSKVPSSLVKHPTIIDTHTGLVWPNNIRFQTGQRLQDADIMVGLRAAKEKQHWLSCLLSMCNHFSYPDSVCPLLKHLQPSFSSDETWRCFGFGDVPNSFSLVETQVKITLCTHGTLSH